MESGLHSVAAQSRPTRAWPTKHAWCWPAAKRCRHRGGNMLDLEKLDFTRGGGRVTIVTQDARSGAVLMVAHADREALQQTLETGEMHYRSRLRGLWHKGAVSGNTQRVVSLTADCDGDAVLARVIPKGPACHTGTASCFGESALLADPIAELDRTIASRAGAAEGPRSSLAAATAREEEISTEAEDIGIEAVADAAEDLEQIGRQRYTRRLPADRTL